MEYQKTFSEAQKFGINRRAAARMRVRYLKHDLRDCLESWARTSNRVSLHWALKTLDEINHLMRRCRKEQAKTKNGVTDEMIEYAKSVPITAVIDFKRGKATAFCHEDKTPSLYHATRINRAACPVCDKKFSAIDVLLERDGYTFIDAVKALQ